MVNRGKTSEHLWEAGWEGHEKAQLLRMSRLPFMEKIKWLEEAQKLVRRLEDQKGIHKDTKVKTGI